MEIVIFVLRTIFLVLIYVFVYLVLIHLIKDLRYSGALATGETAFAHGGQTAGLQAAARRGAETGMLRVDDAPKEYGMNRAEYELSANTRLGRGMENDVVLPGPFASGQHAFVYLRNGQYWIEDNGSRNGTYLNGRPITKPAVLAHGDQIKIGDISFRFVRWDNAVEQDHRTRTGTAEE